MPFEVTAGILLLVEMPAVGYLLGCVYLLLVIAGTLLGREGGRNRCLSE